VKNQRSAMPPNNGMKLTGSAMAGLARPPQLIPVFCGHQEQDQGSRQSSVVLPGQRTHHSGDGARAAFRTKFFHRRFTRDHG
jgi:hypothetical protein